MGNGISLLHFVTFPNFKYWMGLGFRVVLYELRQFRVKGLGYMSLRLRVPNFRISQTVLGHLG